MKVAFIGGSFNPPHKGHLQVAEFIHKELGINKITFLVTPRNPFKSAKELLPIETRVALLKKIANKPWMNISIIETKFRTAESIKTVRLLKKLYPCDDIFFILGMDNLEHFHLWMGYKEILSTTNVIFVNRGGTSIHKILRKSKIPRNMYKILYRRTIAISSTEIRASNILR